MPYEGKNIRGSLVLEFGSWRRHVKPDLFDCLFLVCTGDNAQPD